ncbi:hypothetical protein ACA910_021192 [Epithemia clementina (nom. ined.)]
MEDKALQSIPDVNEDALIEDYAADNSKSVDSDDTEKSIEQIQKNAGQLVAFENCIDENKILENDDQAEDDEYMLVVLKYKAKTKDHI